MPFANDRPSRGSTTLELTVRPEQLRSALAQGLDLPLTALRASMEALNRTLPVDTNTGGVLEGALEEVNRLGRNVRELMEFTAQPDPMPMRCSATEIVASARDSLPSEVRERVFAAHVSCDLPLETDAPILARSLGRVLENALESGSEEVLVVVRQENDTTSFAVVDGSPANFDCQWAMSAFHSTKQSHLGLGLAITERDVTLLNGTLAFERSELGETCVTITVPDHFSSTASAQA